MNIEEFIVHFEKKANELGNCNSAKEQQQIADWLKELLVYRDIIWGIDLYNVIECIYLNKFKGHNINLPIDKPKDL